MEPGFLSPETKLHLVASAVDKLQRYAYARDRQADREERTISLTDDEAAALLETLDL
jgi:hypothetical protein